MRKGALDIEPGAAVVRRRRGAGDQHRPDARRWCRATRSAPPGRTAEVGKLLAEDARRQGRRHGELDLAGRRRREPRPRRWSQPEDAKGMKVRGGSREMDMMLKAAGASVHLAAVERDLRGDADRRHGCGNDVVDEPHLVQAGGDRQDLTSGRNRAYWFMLEPLMMSKEVFDKLPKAQQDIIMAVGRRAGEVRHRRRARRRQDRRRGLRQGRRQGLRPRRRDGEEVAGDRTRHRLEGLSANATRSAQGVADGRAEASVSGALAAPRAPGAWHSDRSGDAARTAAAGACAAGVQSRRDGARHGRAAGRVARTHLQRGLALFPARRRPTGRTRRRCSAGRRDLPVRRLRAVDPRPRRHRGHRRPCCRRASNRVAHGLRRSASASRSAPSSRGSRGRCCTKPGSTARRRPRRGRRRCGYPTG